MGLQLGVAGGLGALERVWKVETKLLVELLGVVPTDSMNSRDYIADSFVYLPAFLDESAAGIQPTNRLCH